MRRGVQACCFLRVIRQAALEFVLVTSPRHFFVFLVQHLKPRFIHTQPLLARKFGGQRQRKAVRLEKIERVGGGDDVLAIALDVFDFFVVLAQPRTSVA